MPTTSLPENQSPSEGGIEGGIINLDMAPMNESEAVRFGIKPEDCAQCVRIDGPLSATRWFKWESVALENGDHVGVLAPAELANGSIAHNGS